MSVGESHTKSSFTKFKARKFSEENVYKRAKRRAKRFQVKSGQTIQPDDPRKIGRDFIIEDDELDTTPYDKRS